MNQSLALESVKDPATVRRGGREIATTRARRVAARPAATASFVERRRAEVAESRNAVRPPLVLGFAGVVSGLMLSAALILGIAVLMALLEVRWSNASHYSVVAVLVVFGGAGIALYWDVGEVATRLMAKIEPAVERRVHYLHLSSLDALENLRSLEHSTRTVSTPTIANALPPPRPEARRTPPMRVETPRRRPVPQPFYSQHAAKAQAPMNNWAWDRAEPA